jgi:hypothetical protein
MKFMMKRPSFQGDTKSMTYKRAAQIGSLRLISVHIRSERNSAKTAYLSSINASKVALDCKILKRFVA